MARRFALAVALCLVAAAGFAHAATPSSIPGTCLLTANRILQVTGLGTNVGCVQRIDNYQSKQPQDGAVQFQNVNSINNNQYVELYTTFVDDSSCSGFLGVVFCTQTDQSATPLPPPATTATGGGGAGGNTASTVTAPTGSAVASSSSSPTTAAPEYQLVFTSGNCSSSLCECPEGWIRVNCTDEFPTASSSAAPRATSTARPASSQQANATSTAPNESSAAPSSAAASGQPASASPSSSPVVQVNDFNGICSTSSKRCVCARQWKKEDCAAATGVTQQMTNSTTNCTTAGKDRELRCPRKDETPQELDALADPDWEHRLRDDVCDVDPDECVCASRFEPLTCPVVPPVFFFLPSATPSASASASPTADVITTYPDGIPVHATIVLAANGSYTYQYDNCTNSTTALARCVAAGEPVKSGWRHVFVQGTCIDRPRSSSSAAPGTSSSTGGAASGSVVGSASASASGDASVFSSVPGSASAVQTSAFASASASPSSAPRRSKMCVCPAGFARVNCTTPNVAPKVTSSSRGPSASASRAPSTSAPRSTGAPPATGGSEPTQSQGVFSFNSATNFAPAAVAVGALAVGAAALLLQ